jgi:hypothetical protein
MNSINGNGNDIQLSDGALEYLYNYKFNRAKETIDDKFIFQIYSCVKIYQSYYSCTLIDSRSKSNNFILNYEEFWEELNKGDIIIIKKINKNILKDGEHFIYLSKDIKIVKKKC